MNQQLRQDADRIIADAIHAVLPDQAVIRALEAASFPGRIRLVAAGKAAWQMAQAASKTLGDSLGMRRYLHQIRALQGKTAENHLLRRRPSHSG